ncbi:hypothetical protein BKA63DRAFT_552649 [Paraphoma chrysanthemicola]|nr:hypothetical protein BKA63DRAFT_552649 [Paraphoma chrysanthemicola]
MIGDVVGSHPPIWPPQADEPVNQPPADEPATFYVADYRQPPNAEGQAGVSVYGIHHGDCDWLVKGNGPNANPEDLSTNIKLRDFAADINDVALGPGQQLPAFYYYHDELPKFNGFTLKGRRKGVCGLDAVFEFKKVQDGKYSFTDKGPGGPITGYCNVVTSDSEKHKQMCVGKDGDNLGHTINIEEVLACYAPGNPTYCTNYGKP